MIPAEFANPVDTASRSTGDASSDDTAQGDAAGGEPRLSERDEEILRKRREENEEYVSILQKIAEKAWKVKIAEGDLQRLAASPETDRLLLTFLLLKTLQTVSSSELKENMRYLWHNFKSRQ